MRGKLGAVLAMVLILTMTGFAATAKRVARKSSATLTGGTWTYNVAHSFSGSDGEEPIYGRVVFGKQGHVFGTTCCGGTDGEGVVWGIKGSVGNYQEFTLYNFTGSSDGASPYGGLRLTKAGHLAGAATFGGSNGYGVSFELVHGSGGWSQSVLYSFTGGTDGGYPFAGANADKAGNIYGTTEIGGTSGAGTVYMISGAK